MERLDHQAAFTIVVLYYPIPGLVKVDSGVPSALDRTSYITMLRLIALYCVVLYCIALCFIHYLICIQHNAMQCNYLICPRSGELRTQKLKSHLVRSRSLNVLHLKPRVGQ